MIKNYEELSDNLMIDLNDPLKKIMKFPQKLKI